VQLSSPAGFKSWPMLEMLQAIAWSCPAAPAHNLSPKPLLAALGLSNSLLEAVGFTLSCHSAWQLRSGH